MNYAFHKLITVFLLTPPSSAYAEANSSLDTSASPAPLNEKMQSLHKTLSELLINVSSDQRYFDFKNTGRIEMQIKELASLAHDLKSKGVSSTHSDASIRIYADHLNSDASEACRSFHEGRKDYSRGLIRSLIHFCVACRSSSGTVTPLTNT